MRPSAGLFLGVKKAIASARNIAVEEGAPDAAYFHILPPPLQRFFTRYPPRPFKEYSSKPTSTRAEDANPFLANKHPVTGRYHDPKYSMRRQSVLWKIAYQFGIQDALPPLQGDKKFYEEKYKTRAIMKGALRPKGAKYERNLPERRAKMAEGIRTADEKINAIKSNHSVKRREAKREKHKKNWV